VPCRPQMGQEMVWPTQRHTIQHFGSLKALNSVKIGMHWKLTTHATGFLQPNAVLPLSQTRVATWQPVLSGARHALETNHPCDRNKSNQIEQYCFATESDQVGQQCPVGSRWARKWCGSPKDIPYDVLAACTYSVGLCLHWKLTTHLTEIVQTNSVFPQSQTRMVTSVLVKPKWARKRCGPPKDLPYYVLAA